MKATYFKPLSHHSQTACLPLTFVDDLIFKPRFDHADSPRRTRGLTVLEVYVSRVDSQSKYSSDWSFRMTIALRFLDTAAPISPDRAQGVII